MSIHMAWNGSARGPQVSGPLRDDGELGELLKLLKLSASPVRDWLKLQSSSENVLLKRKAKTPGSFQIP